MVSQGVKKDLESQALHIIGAALDQGALFRHPIFETGDHQPDLLSL